LTNATDYRRLPAYVLDLKKALPSTWRARALELERELEELRAKHEAEQASKSPLILVLALAEQELCHRNKGT
jgi:hypothetical protein